MYVCMPVCVNYLVECMTHMCVSSGNICQIAVHFEKAPNCIFVDMYVDLFVDLYVWLDFHDYMHMYVCIYLHTYIG